MAETTVNPWGPSPSASSEELVDPWAPKSPEEQQQEKNKAMGQQQMLAGVANFGKELFKDSMAQSEKAFSSIYGGAAGQTKVTGSNNNISQQPPIFGTAINVNNPSSVATVPMIQSPMMSDRRTKVNIDLADDPLDSFLSYLANEGEI